MRKPFIIANWKTNKNVHESVAFVKAIKEKLHFDVTKAIEINEESEKVEEKPNENASETVEKATKTPTADEDNAEDKKE